MKALLIFVACLLVFACVFVTIGLNFSGPKKKDGMKN